MVWILETKRIDQTRKNIEYVYENLSKANESNLGDLISWTNVALNTAHQNGSILDYITEEDIDFKGKNWYMNKFLQALTDGEFINIWDNELKEIGMEY